jgi:membrane protein YqaA with SNARE-associated domain
LVFAALFVTQSQLVAAVLATLTAVGNLLGGLQRLGIGKKEEP